MVLRENLEEIREKDKERVLLFLKYNNETLFKQTEKEMYLSALEV